MLSFGDDDESLEASEPEREIIRVPRPKPIVRVPKPKRVPKPAGYKASPLVIVHKDEVSEEEIKNILSTVSGFITNLSTDMEGNATKWYDYQEEFAENTSFFRSVDKSRQVGFSYGMAGEALAKCHLKKLHTSIFISYNQEEANEKIRFARALYESLPLEFKKKLVVDNKQSLEFDLNGFRTRILSFAQRQPRGKGGHTDINLDEFAHMMWAREIYTASLPVITRGSGVLTVGSTPLGKGNLHYEISSDVAKYPMFSRQKIYWWDCPELCIDVSAARKQAFAMTTKERVYKYATQKMKALYDASDTEENFMQEYELYYVDETVSYYPMDLIQRCTFEFSDRLQLESNIDPEEAPVAWAPIEINDNTLSPDTIMESYKDSKIYWYYNSCKISTNNENAFDLAKEEIDKFAFEMRAKSFGRYLLAGMDIGRKRDTSEISVFEQIDVQQHNLHIERFSIELDNIKFKVQRRIVKYLIETLQIVKMRIDATGLGQDMSETLHDEYPGIIESIEFNIENKGEMAKKFRYRLEDRAIAIYNDYLSIKHIHSIKKTVTESSNTKYGTERNVKDHHGDKFWAKALASSCGDDYDRNKISSTSLRYSGSRIFVDNALVKPVGMPNVLPVVSKNKIGVTRNTENNNLKYDDPMMSMFADLSYREVF